MSSGIPIPYFLLQTDAHQAAESAVEPLTPLMVAAFAGSPPDMVGAWQMRRTELMEGASALQRWVVALFLEAARQMEAAKTLHALGEQVGFLMQLPLYVLRNIIMVSKSPLLA